jgi:hypothetical protein
MLDLGMDFVNIPLVPSKMRDYMLMTGSIGGDKPLNFFGDDGMDMEDYASSDTEYGSDGNYSVRRPFKMLAWAAWRPFGIQLFSLLPTFGFSINPLYIEPFSLEAGLKARVDIMNIFIATAGVGYYDRLWRNSLDLALNFRVFEFNIGADLRSTDFDKSWKGGGFGVNAGVKFGF